MIVIIGARSPGNEASAALDIDCFLAVEAAYFPFPISLGW